VYFEGKIHTIRIKLVELYENPLSVKKGKR